MFPIYKCIRLSNVDITIHCLGWFCWRLQVITFFSVLISLSLETFNDISICIPLFLGRVLWTLSYRVKSIWISMWIQHFENVSHIKWQNSHKFHLIKKWMFERILKKKSFSSIFFGDIRGLWTIYTSCSIYKRYLRQ